MKDILEIRTEDQKLLVGILKMSSDGKVQLEVKNGKRQDFVSVESIQNQVAAFLINKKKPELIVQSNCLSAPAYFLGGK